MSCFADWERALLRELSKPLPLTAQPFADVAERAGVTEAQVIARVREWTADGTIRRFGARVSHRTIGYAANGMSVWDVPDHQVEEAAACMTGQSEVSHCYLRPRHASWPYNLYAMIHGASEDEVHAVAQRIARATGVDSYRVLFSSRELKKTAPRYFAEGDTEA